jgi:glycosyltransferase involved in cell wall biosynthesis
MTMPKVSILVPSYNASVFLDESITSALNQTFTDFELIIVDNCSTDDSEEIISKYLADKRIKYYRNEKNIGVVNNFNKCLSYASGEYIKFLCSDDKLHSELLEKSVSVMDQYPNVLLVASFFEDFGFASRIVKTPFTHLVNGKKAIYQILNNYNYLGQPSNVMIRKSALSVGNFNNEFCWMADWELWLRILSIGDCYIIPEVLSYARDHDNRVSRAMQKKFNNYFENYKMVKAIKKHNELHLDFKEFDIDKVIKKKATDCTLAIPWTIMGFGKKENRKIFINAFSIAFTESVFASSFVLLSKRLANRMFKLIGV